MAPVMKTMPVIDFGGQPLQKDHPFSGTRIIFGAKQPSSSENSSKTLGNFPPMREVDPMPEIEAL